jgi:hypothetical protein
MLYFVRLKETLRQQVELNLSEVKGFLPHRKNPERCPLPFLRHPGQYAMTLPNPPRFEVQKAN